MFVKSYKYLNFLLFFFINLKINSFQINDFKIIGLSYNNISKDIYKNIYIKPSFTEQFNSFDKNVSILSTCNRLEVIYLENKDTQKNKIKNEIFKISKFKELDNKIYYYQGKKAIHHICSTACGLYSNVFGEHEIMHQIKDYYKKLKSKQLITLFNKILFISKKIRNKTNLKRCNVSISSITVKFIYDNYIKKNKNIKNQNICIIGYGNLGKKLYKLIKNRNISKNIDIFTSKNITNFNSFDYDIIFTASSNQIPIKFFKNMGSFIIIADLGFPSNIDYTKIKNKYKKNMDYYNLTFFENISKQNELVIRNNYLNISKQISNYINHFF